MRQWMYGPRFMFAVKAKVPISHEPVDGSSRVIPRSTVVVSVLTDYPPDTIIEVVKIGIRWAYVRKRGDFVVSRVRIYDILDDSKVRPVPGIVSVQNG